MKRKNVDEEFDAILRDALDKACAVKCSIPQYCDALRQWIEEIKMTLNAAAAEDHEQEKW